jgi:hypothetical protein
MRPYIGITDFTCFEQVKEMLKVFSANKPQNLDCQLHVGVMMSYKTLNGIPSKWQKAFPQKEKIADIFASQETYNCLHFADYDNYPDLDKTLARALSYGGNNLNALQLDMVWPDPGQIARGVGASKKDIEVILQIGKLALEQCGNDPSSVVKKLGDYQGIIHRVLLDKSMGKGLGMDAAGLIPFARAIKNDFLDLGLGAAGGLGPETVLLVEPLIAEFFDLSFDAQGKLRPSGNALDPIDWNMAAAYLVKALQLCALYSKKECYWPL